MSTGPDDLGEDEVDEDQGWRGLIEHWIAGLPVVDESEAPEGTPP